MNLTKTLLFKKIIHAARRPFFIGTQQGSTIEALYEKELYVSGICKRWRKEGSKLLLTKR